MYNRHYTKRFLKSFNKIVRSGKVKREEVEIIIDILASGTRREDLLMDKETLQKVWLLRKYMADMNPMETMEFLLDKMKGTRNNEEFLMTMNR